MSLLMWSQHPEEFAILTDTLTTNFAGDPAHFQTKCWTLPHLKLVVAGTGFAQILERWNHYLQQNMLARDITMLNNHAPSALRRLWDEAMSDPEVRSGEQTVTFYHFGRDEASGALVRYTYRSTENFESEFGLDPSFAVKPQPSQAVDPVPETLEEMIDLACRIRDDEDKRPKRERVHIGGELILTLMQGDAVTSTPVYRWPDYDDMWNAMNALAFAAMGGAAT